MHKKILHGLDGSEGSFKALTEAIDIAKRYEADLHTISVEEVPRMPETIGEMIEEKDSANGFFKEAVEKARQMASAQGLTIHPHVIVGHEVKTILEYIKHHEFDLLVLGFMGHSAIYDRVMGSTCQSLIRLAPCSVLVVK
ncbi:MAG: universal stress protein [Kiritimatiellae bacterium]|nr:universal stress protein [Kiritimatiellia bacterium]